MADITLSIEGLDEFQAALEALDDKVATKIIRKAVRAGAQVVKAEMVNTAPRDTGLLAEHFDVKTRKMPGEARAVSALVGPNGKEVLYPRTAGKTAGMPRTAALIGRDLEFGTATRAKHPWLTASFETTKQQALEAIVDVLRDELGWSFTGLDFEDSGL